MSESKSESELESESKINYFLSLHKILISNDKFTINYINENDTYIRNFLLTIFDKKMKYLESYMIKDKKFIHGNSFTIIDAYLHIVLGWTGYVGIDLNNYENALKYKKYIESIPEVKKAKNRMAFFPKTTV